MPDVQLNQLLEAGVHFGHQTSRWNPKMRRYIFTDRNGIHIIDLRKTLDHLRRAQSAVQDVVRGGDRVLFVCTKRQLRGIVQSEAERAGAFYVTERWLGGMLTNFQTIRKQIRRLKELERGQEEGAFEFYTKKERLLLDRERQKLDKYLSGVKDMSRLPGAIFVVDAKREIIAVREAYKLDIPVIAIADTNADPDLIEYPIPGNDDAIRSVSLITGAIAEAIVDARRSMPEDERPAEFEATTYSTETGEQRAEESRPRKKARAEGKKEDEKKEQPKKRRRPRPEVIAQIRSLSDEEGEEGEGEDVDAEAGEAPGAEDEGVDEPEAAVEGPEEPGDADEDRDDAGEEPEAEAADDEPADDDAEEPEAEAADDDADEPEADGDEEEDEEEDEED